MKKGPTNSERETLLQAIEAAKTTLDASVSVLLEPAPTRDLGYDALLSVTVNGSVEEFSAVVRRNITTENLGSVTSQLRHLEPRGILVAHQITPQQADKLRRMEIPFIDTAGNIFLKSSANYVFVSGRRTAKLSKLDQATRALGPSGLRTIFALLSIPGLERKGYREIATAASVSHGTVGWIIGDLEQQGFIVDMGARGRRLVNKRKLLTKWVEAFPERLRPKLIIGRFDSPDRTWWLNDELAPQDGLWGGEVAAAKMTNHLRPAVATIYASSSLPNLQARHRLRRDENGNLEILRKFWEFDQTDSPSVIAPPLLVYADLLASGDERNIETAEIFYESHIARLVDESHSA